MKRIGIDARLSFQTGVGVYIRNFLYYLQKYASSEYEFYIYVMENDSSKLHFSQKNFIKREVNYTWHSFNEQLGFAFKLYSDNLDLMHFTYFSYPILYRKKFVATIHDTTILSNKTGKASTKHPFIYQLKHAVFQQVLSQQVKKATLVITPTETVKNHLSKLYTKMDKVVTIPEGVNYELLNVKENLNLGKKFNKDFFLYIGNFYPHKNVNSLVEAFSQIQGDTKLILVGPDDYFKKKVVEQIKKFNQEERVLFYTNASEEDKVFFLKHAKALIHPSLGEGFGLPLLEAAYFNLPIIASDIPVFKEILGNQYLSFNPGSVNDIKNKVEYFLENDLKFNYESILKRYSFESMSKQIYQYYEKLLV